jgi:hypothetical protein
MTEPILDHMAQDKNLAREAWANTLAVLTYDNGVDAAEGQGANQIAIKLLKTWMQSFQFSTSDGNSSGSLKATLIRNGLLSYGKKRPKVRSCQFQLPQAYLHVPSDDRHTILLGSRPMKLRSSGETMQAEASDVTRSTCTGCTRRSPLGLLVF